MAFGWITNINCNTRPFLGGDDMNKQNRGLPWEGLKDEHFEIYNEAIKSLEEGTLKKGTEFEGGSKKCSCNTCRCKKNA